MKRNPELIHARYECHSCARLNAVVANEIRKTKEAGGMHTCDMITKT